MRRLVDYIAYWGDNVCLHKETTLKVGVQSLTTMENSILVI